MEKVDGISGMIFRGFCWTPPLTDGMVAGSVCADAGVLFEVQAHVLFSGLSF